MPLPTVTPEPVPYTNHMARQFNGDVIQSILKAAHEQFNTYGNALVAHRSAFSLDTATTEELNLLGLALNVPRPYAVVNDVSVPADDATYVRFFKNVMALRNSQSYLSLADVFYQFIPSGTFDLQINEQTGDLRIVMDDRFSQYKPFLEQAVNSVYTASPRLTPIETRDYFTFFWDELLYARFILLAQPNEWAFTFDANSNTLSITSVTLNSISVDARPNEVSAAPVLVSSDSEETDPALNPALIVDQLLCIDRLYPTNKQYNNPAPALGIDGRARGLFCFTPPELSKEAPTLAPDAYYFVPVWQWTSASEYTPVPEATQLVLLFGLGKFEYTATPITPETDAFATLYVAADQYPVEKHKPLVNRYTANAPHMRQIRIEDDTRLAININDVPHTANMTVTQEP